MATTDARPIPKKNTAYRHCFAIRNAAGEFVTGWTGQDSERSLDQAAFADCTNEATEIGSSGIGYIDLTAAEMNADCVILKITVTNSGAIPLVFFLYPQEAGDIQSTTEAINANVITATSINAAAITAAKFGSGAITSSVLGSNCITNTQIAADAIGSSELAATAATEIATAVWANGTRILTAGTNIVLAKGVGVTGFNDLSAAAVNAEVDTALLDYDGPTKTEFDAGLAGLNNLSAADVWGHATAVSLVSNVGEILTDTGTTLPDGISAVLSAIGGLNNISAGDVLTQVSSALATYDGPTKAELDSAETVITNAIAALNNLSAATVNAEVDAALAEYDGPTKAELDTAQGVIEAAIAGLNNLSAAAVNAEVDAALADYDGPTKAELDAGLATLNNLSAAQVTTAVQGVIETNHLDHLLAAAYDPASKPGNASALFNVLVENDGGVPRYTINALEQAPSGGGGGGGATPAEIWAYAADGLAAIEYLKICGSVLAGKCSIVGSIVSFRDLSDSRNAVIVVGDGEGNRTAATYDGGS